MFFLGMVLTVLLHQRKADNTYGIHASGILKTGMASHQRAQVMKTHNVRRIQELTREHLPGDKTR